jgi:hypothetical protein
METNVRFGHSLALIWWLHIGRYENRVSNSKGLYLTDEELGLLSAYSDAELLHQKLVPSAHVAQQMSLMQVFCDLM